VGDTLNRQDAIRREVEARGIVHPRSLPDLAEEILTIAINLNLGWVILALDDDEQGEWLEIRSVPETEGQPIGLNTIHYLKQDLVDKLLGELVGTDITDLADRIISIDNHMLTAKH